MQAYHYLHILDSRKIVTRLQDKCIRSVIERKRTQDTHELLVIPYVESKSEQIYLADCARLEKAYTTPNLVYCDTDLFLSKPLHEMNIDTSLPYFGEYTFNTKHNGMPDIFFFFVNNCCDYFKKYLPISKLSKDKYSFNVDDLTRLKDYKLFDEFSYIHMYNTMESQYYSNCIIDLENKIYKLELEIKK